MKKLCLILMTFMIVFCTACSNSAVQNAGKELEDGITNLKDADNQYVKLVKNGHPNDNPNMTYDKAFTEFFGTPRWKYFKSDENLDIVEFTGDCTYQDVDVKARIQFVVDEENGTFEATYLAFNEVPQSNLIMLGMFEKIFEGSSDVSTEENSAQATINTSTVELNKTLSAAHLSLRVPSLWERLDYNEEGYAYFDIDCKNENIEMSVFESRDAEEDVRAYNFSDDFDMNVFIFDDGSLGHYTYSKSKIMYTYETSVNGGTYSAYYLVDYSDDPVWFEENRDLVDNVAKTLFVQWN